MALESGTAQPVEAFIAAGYPSSCEQNVDDWGAGYIISTVLAGDTETRVQVEDIELDAMMFRVVSPRGSTGNLSCIIYYHGGCSVSGGFITYDNQLRQLAWYSGCRVIAVQYRLVPEHIFPAAHNDTESGANIIWKYAKKLGVDRDNTTLAGDSAGGHLVLVTVLRPKVTKQWQPVQVMLTYLMLDAAASFASYDHNGQDYITTHDTLPLGYKMYMPQTDPLHLEASPLWREDFNGLPPTHIIIAEFDPLRDEGEALYQRFQKQGVDYTCQCYLGVIHGFFQLARVSRAARSVMRDVTWHVINSIAIRYA